jgi:ribosomal protein S12 methylthiotransferase accessory factor
MELVSPRVGIVTGLERVAKGRREPEIPIVYRATLAHFDYRRAEAGDRYSGGKGFTEPQSRISAIGEALERYCSSQVDPARLVLAPQAELPAPAFDPASLVLYSDAQYARLPYQRPQPGMALTWIAGRCPLTAESRYVPASMVYMGYGGPGMSEIFAMSTSSGLAAGPNLDFAIRSAILELVERDAFLLTWMNRLPAPEIELDQINGAAGQAVRHYARNGVELRVFHLLNGLSIHACMAIALDRERGVPAAVAGLGCDLDPAAAVRNAIMEVAQVRPGVVQRCWEKMPEIGRYEEVRSLEDHSNFFAMPSHLSELDFLLKGGNQLSMSTLPNYASGCASKDVETCAKALAVAGSQVAYVDLTTKDLVDYPVAVVRAVATELQPMHFGFGNERLGGNRLFTIAKALSFAGQHRAAAELNFCPHPLA